jgi:hypothetical protein
VEREGEAIVVAAASSGYNIGLDVRCSAMTTAGLLGASTTPLLQKSLHLTPGTLKMDPTAKADAKNALSAALLRVTETGRQVATTSQRISSSSEEKLTLMTTRNEKRSKQPVFKLVKQKKAM